MDRLPRLLDHLGLHDLDPARATITGADPVLPSRYPLGESAAAVLAALGLALVRLGEARGAPAQGVEVDVRHAGALLRGFLDQVRDGEVLDPDPTSRLPFAGLHRAANGGWVQLHGVFPPLRERTAEVLRLPEDAGHDAVAAAVARWPAEGLAEALAAAGAPGATVRTAAEWAAHPQGRLLGATPVVTVERIADAPPRPLPPLEHDDDRPLTGVRVLDLTRVVAGPTAGRTLAEHGAEVLACSSPGLHAVGRALVETSPGKRMAELDLTDGDDRLRLDALLAGADVVCQSARPGSFARRGLGPADVAALRPGVVYASVDAFGAEGPWASRAGFEPLAQAATGWAADHRDATGAPAIVPTLPCDHVTGFLLALGVADALHRRATAGGSWHVRASLARTAMWLRDEPGRHDPAGAPALDALATADLRDRVDGPYGAVDQLRPSPWLTRTPPRWDRPATPPGTDPPAWA